MIVRSAGTTDIGSAPVVRSAIATLVGTYAVSRYASRNPFPKGGVSQLDANRPVAVYSTQSLYSLSVLTSHAATNAWPSLYRS